MIVLSKAYWGYGEDPVTYFNLERFAGEAGNYHLGVGFINFKCIESLPDNSVALMCFEEPNGFFGPEMFLCHRHLNKVFKVFTICPYTAEWSNSRFPGNKWEASFIPFNEELVPPPVAKEFDLVYSGSERWGTQETIAAMRQVKGCFIHFNQAPHVTHVGVSYREKLNLFAKSRIAVVHNLLFPEPVYVDGIWRDRPDALFRNRALEQLAQRRPNPLMPQLKTRLFEAAFCRALILCRRDPWNLAERFFEPGKEFVYYDEGNLAPTVKAILSDYGRYLPVVEAAHRRALAEYTTRRYFDKHLKDLGR